MGLRLSSRTRPQDAYIIESETKSNSSAKIDNDWIDQRPSQRTETKSRAKFRGTDAKSFAYSCILGRGVAGTVRLVRHRSTKKFYALKCMRRSSIAHRKAAERTKREVDVLRLARGQCPFVTHLFRAFQDEVHVYLLLEYAAGGELYGQILKHKRLSLNVTKFYTAEITLALHFIHTNGMAYRDLKPDNILIDHTGHILLCDFGLVRPINKSSGLVLNASAGGSTSYKAPEITRGHQEPHGIAVDWWALGVCCYEMFTGKTPFGNRSRDAKYEIYAKINKGKVKYTSSMPSNMKEMLQNLMNLKQQVRWGYNDVIKCPFFDDINWDLLKKKNYIPPWIPELLKKGDHANFNKWREPKYPVTKLSTDQIAYSNILGRE